MDTDDIERLRAGLSETTFLLYRLWRCRSDRERAELGWEIAHAMEKYGAPSHQTKECGL